jgi:hypothetical protein
MALPEAVKKAKNVFVEIFSRHWEEFKTKHPSYDRPQYEEPVQKMLGCGREEGGYSEYRCTSCGRGLRRVAFSCKGSFCLSCARGYVDRVVGQVSRMLHAGVVYRHVILTVPEQLRGYFYRARHDRDLLSGLMQCGYQCLEDVVRTARRQRLKIGAIIVVQTHGRSGRYNPHLHVILTDGGINEKEGKWVDLGYFPYTIIQRKWQYHLLHFVQASAGTPEMDRLVEELWQKYPKGFVAHVTKGRVPQSCRGLARYLAKYVACPPIAVRRILSYDGEKVTYRYKDHETKANQTETVDVEVFIGRMVQHILPKGQQRIRYYGLEATKSFTKWQAVVKEGMRKIGRVVAGAYQIIARRQYRERYQEVSGRDPMVCEYCGKEMDLWRRWHPKWGVIYAAAENLKRGKCEEREGLGDGGGPSIRPASHRIQLSLFPV